MIEDYNFNPYLVSCVTVSMNKYPKIGKTLGGARTVRWYELLYFPESNDGHTIIGDRHVPNPPGSIMLRKPGTVMKSITAFSSYNIAFDPTYDPTFVSHYENGQFETPPQDLTSTLIERSCPLLEQLPETLIIPLHKQNTCQALFKEAFQLHLARPTNYHLKSRCILYAIFDLIFDVIDQENHGYDSNIKPTLQRLSEAKNYMNANLTSVITLKELAELTGYSREAFCRLFKKHYASSPINYLIDLRLIRAKELLLTTDLTLEHIAHESGFTSPIHFSTTFKARIGLPPGRYRQNHRE